MLIIIGDTAVHAERIQSIQVRSGDLLSPRSPESYLVVTLEGDSRSQTEQLHIANFPTLEDARKYRDSIVEKVNHYLNEYW